MFIRVSAIFLQCGFFCVFISLIGFYFNSFLTQILVLFYVIIENYCADNQHFIT